LDRLESRPLTEADAAWLTDFRAGEEYWAKEVTNFLQENALDHGKGGYSRTTLFSVGDGPEIVGFVSAAASALRPAEVQLALGDWEGQDPEMARLPVPALLIPYFGIDERYQGQAFGEEMHVRVLRSLEFSVMSPRFVYLQVWAESPAVKFWTRLGYVEFDRADRNRPDGHGKAPLLKMLLDRELIE
jgi:ribosomal protein S18 acetylase RimI-like enzyme